MSLTILLLYPYLLGTSSIGVCLTVIWYITEPPIGIHYSELIFHGILTFVGFIMQTSKLWAQLIFVTIYIYLFFTCSIWAGKLQWLGEKIVIWTKYNFFKTPVTCYLLIMSVGESSCKFRLLPVDRKYHKGQSRENEIILLFNSRYKRD